MTIKKAITIKKQSKTSGLLMASMLILMSIVIPAAAQSAGSAVILPVELDDFPTITFQLEVYDGAGNFITDLEPEDVVVMEDNQPHQVEEMNLVEPGIQLILAINAAPTLANYANGVPFYDQIRTALLNWASNQRSPNPNDLTLVTNTGLQAIQLNEPAEWLAALEAYQPDLLRSQPGMTSLTQAVDMAADRSRQPYMKRAILYITPPPSTTNQTAIADIADRAAQLGVRVFVWMVAPDSYTSSQAAESLQDLAVSTGGSYFHFTGFEALPDFALEYEPMRYQYRTTYVSTISETDKHNLQVKVERDGEEIISNFQSVNVNIAQPNPMFLTPPGAIARIWQKPDDESGDPPTLQPESVEIPILVEFSEGSQRPIKRSLLYVDGEIVAENLEAPFDVFVWPLEEYTEDGAHTIQVAVEDDLGTVKTSIETRVDMTVEPPLQGWFGKVFSGQRLVIGLSLLLAAVVLFVVLVVARRGRVDFIRRWQNRRQVMDPLTQPIEINHHGGRYGTARSAVANTPTQPREVPKKQPPARLVFLDDDNQVIPGKQITLTQPILTFGRDPEQAMYVLKEPSVGDLHARIFRRGEEDFYLADNESIAGTWINYTPVSSSGSKLQHGDLLHIGRVAFRFELSHPRFIRKPRVVPIQKDDL
jgi:hypothetical protein